MIIPDKLAETEAKLLKISTEYERLYAETRTMLDFFNETLYDLSFSSNMTVEQFIEKICSLTEGDIQKVKLMRMMAELLHQAREQYSIPRTLFDGQGGNKISY